MCVVVRFLGFRGLDNECVLVIDRKGVTKEEVKLYIQVGKDSKVNEKGWRKEK